MFSKNYQDIGRTDHVKHDILLKENKPIFQKQYPVPDAHRPDVEAQIKDWLKMGIIQPSTSRYNSPMIMVPKKDGSLRVVQDFRGLNVASHDDRYSMKTVNECIGDIGRAGSTLFSTSDITHGF